MDITAYVLSFGGSWVNGDTAPASILLGTGPEGQTRGVALVKFHATDEPPRDAVQGNIIMVNMPIRVLPSVIDMLRNEKPIELAQASNGRYVLRTKLERVGEWEGLAG